MTLIEFVACGWGFVRHRCGKYIAIVIIITTTQLYVYYPMPEIILEATKINDI